MLWIFVLNHLYLFETAVYMDVISRSQQVTSNYIYYSMGISTLAGFTLSKFRLLQIHPDAKHNHSITR
jgi:hypothetical protein